MLRLRTMLPLLSTAAAAACIPDAAATPAPAGDAATPVVVATVRTSRDETPVRVAGRLQAKEEIPLAFLSGGVVATIPVEPGDRVRAGQLLAQLTREDVEAAIRKADEGRRKAERDLVRVRQLFADSVATQAQLDDAITGVAVAAADVRAAEFAGRYARISAPAAGLVLRRAAEPGQLVAGGQPVLVLRTERRGLIVRAGVADREALRLAIGDPATVRLDALGDRVFRGRVAVIGASPDPGTGTYDVDVAVEGVDPSLASGLVARVEITPRPRAGAAATVRVPVDALVEADGDSAAVFVLLPDGTARRRTVRLGTIGPDAVVVRDGLAAGEVVIVAGGAYLVDGRRVRVTGDAR